LVKESVHMITNLPTERFKAMLHANNFRFFTYKMVAKTGWHREETKLRHCHAMYYVHVVDMVLR